MGVAAEPRPATRQVVLGSAQADFLASTARYPGLFGGRGTAKSTTALFKGIQYMTQYNITTGYPHGYAMFTVPTLDQINKIFRPRLSEFFGEWQGVHWVYNKKETTLEWPQFGWTWWLRPASEPDSCRGPNLAWAAMDEISTEDQEETFRILQGAIRLTPFPNQIWVTSTPKVERRWIQQRWQDKINPLDGQLLPNPHQYPIFKAKTEDATWLPDDYKKELIGEWGSSRWAAQELHGEFISLEGLAFPDLGEKHRREWPENQKPKAIHAGFDLGDVRPTSIVLWYQDEGNRLYAVDEFYKRNAIEQDWLQWCADRQIFELTVDPSISDKQIEDWRRRTGIRMKRAVSNVKSFSGRYMIWNSKLAIRDDGLPGLYISNKCPNLWNEMLNLAFNKPRGHEFENSAWTPNSSDHAYDAAAYGMSAFDSKRYVYQPTVLVESGWNW